MDFDYGKKSVHPVCTVIILVGIGFIFHWAKKDRFYPPEKQYGPRGTYWTGGWTTLVKGIALFIGGFVMLFAFG